MPLPRAKAAADVQSRQEWKDSVSGKACLEASSEGQVQIQPYAASHWSFGTKCALKAQRFIWVSAFKVCLVAEAFSFKEWSSARELAAELRPVVEWIEMSKMESHDYDCTARVRVN